MAERDARRDDSDWIFAGADPGIQHTEQLPGSADLDALAAVLAPKGPAPASPRRDDADPTPAAASPSASHSAEDRAPTAQSPGSASPSYARSGTTPSAPEGPRSPLPVLPTRFAALSWWDAVRDIAALLALLTACTVTFTEAEIGPWLLAPRIAIGIAVASLIAVHLLRWIPAEPQLAIVRAVRVAGMVPAVLVALATILADVVTALPVLFAPLPEGPPVGIGVGVSLLLLGGALGAEPRRHEGFLPGERARARTRRVLLVIGGTVVVMLLLALVMIVGRLLTTGWAFSLHALGDAVPAALLLGIVLAAGLRRERSRYVFAVAAVSGLVLGALADSALRLQFALPRSVATGFVHLPLLFAAFAVMVSRSFVRTMPLSFRRADWLVYTVRTFEFSVLMHGAAAVASLLFAAASAGGVGWGGPVLHIIDAVMAAIFAVMSHVGRKALLERTPASARSSAVVAALVMVLLGFLDVIVNSVLSGAGAGLVTGGVALAVGIAVALMLTVPAPVRDRFGAPDLVQMFDEYRRRDVHAKSLLAKVPDVRAEISERKEFPRR